VTITILPRAGWLLAAGVGALAIAGCSSASDKGSAAPAQGSDTGLTVNTRNVAGTGEVLVDAHGRTLYASEQEMSGKILCSSKACTTIWTPLTVGNGQKPAGPSSVMGMLATVKRPDGTSQVAFKGAPLYTFSFDHAAGDVSGEGQKDSFDGTNFVWHAATPAGAAAPAPSQSAASSSDGGGNGGY
jgi:predicted lipoprotein with Yx(FWY)xxD motif